ncbi:helix-turn-helix transcriptional regulator [Halobacillus rhizosphaerae]|uniref:helix-turn-helix domain-containing protein n=1 Tax=Halobacillus rhizosphaerae TaxID=3064889 RepID=UPI00398A556A
MKGSLIKQHRKFKNLTLEDLAQGICSVSYLSKIEHNSINASDEIYRLLGERLSITLTDINQKFDETIYENLHQWHEAIQMRDFSIMKEYQSYAEKALNKNQNIDLLNLYHIIQVRHNMTLNETSISKEKMKELKGIFPEATAEYHFFYYKTVGLDFFINGEIRDALDYFRKANQMMNKLPLEDSETYFHLSLAYSRTRSAVESNFYAEKALEGYTNSLEYSKIIDSYTIIAINYQILNAYDIAKDYFLKILKVAKNHLNFIEKRRIFHNLGYININMENYTEALYYLYKAKDITTEDTEFNASTNYLLSLAHYYSGDREKCLDFIEIGEEEAKSNAALKYQHKFFILKNKLQETTHQMDFIAKLEQNIIPDLRNMNEYDDYKDNLELLGNLYYNKRMYKKASMYFKEANNYKSTQKKDLL